MILSLWLVPVEPDGSRWPVMASATLEQGGEKDVVRMFDRKGEAAGAISLPPGDGELFLRRLGMELSPPP